MTIVDYGMGNVQSVCNALNHLRVANRISADPETVAQSDALILPGVGSFHAAMANIQQRGLLAALHSAVLSRGVAVLGICLGMQLLAEIGHEGGTTRGLGWIPGEVRPMTPHQGLRLPHIGFNQLRVRNKELLFTGMEEGADFYFVHSYHFIAAHSEDVIGLCDYGTDFVGAIRRKNVWGVQFHPEKSQANGLRLLENFARISGELEPLPC